MFYRYDQVKYNSSEINYWSIYFTYFIGFFLIIQIKNSFLNFWLLIVKVVLQLIMAINLFIQTIARLTAQLNWWQSFIFFFIENCCKFAVAMFDWLSISYKISILPTFYYYSFIKTVFFDHKIWVLSHFTNIFKSPR